MSDFLGSMATSIEAEQPALPADVPEAKTTDTITAEKVAGMIEQALKSNDEKTRSIMQEVIDANIEKLATYKPEEKKEEDIENG